MPTKSTEVKIVWHTNFIQPKQEQNGFNLYFTLLRNVEQQFELADLLQLQEKNFSSPFQN